jgi:hypothetical protein
MTERTIAHALFGLGINSANRLEALLRLVERQPSRVFWPAFIEGWPNCDATWLCQRELLKLLRAHHAEDPGPGYLPGDCREFFDGLPDPVEVFRGCSRPRIQGASWTTNRAVAEGFARGHRGIRVPDPVIASAVIPKEVIFAAFTDRQESEIVLDPRRLAKLSAGGRP